MPEKLILPAEFAEIMRAHVQRCIPEEACGILGGTGNLVKCVLPVTNELHSPVKFRMAPEEQLKTFIWLEQNGFDMVAYFHSHPTGPGHLSETDLLQFFYPGVVLVLLYPQNSTWQIKGFIINKKYIKEINIEPSQAK
jgi:[CysO sulfur-carrier protein]-S-L-cysteine hydrolase